MKRQNAVLPAEGQNPRSSGRG